MLYNFTMTQKHEYSSLDFHINNADWHQQKQLNILLIKIRHWFRSFFPFLFFFFFKQWSSSLIWLSCIITLIFYSVAGAPCVPPFLDFLVYFSHHLCQCIYKFVMGFTKMNTAININPKTHWQHWVSCLKETEPISTMCHVQKCASSWQVI